MPLDVKAEQYCMILSKYRLVQGLALYYSLKKVVKSFKIYILCMDIEAFVFINRLTGEEATPISIELLEDDYLYTLKQNRALEEYCWTLKPVFLEYLLRNFTDITRITYLDADLFFYAKPNRIFDDSNEYSVLLSNHDFSRRYKCLEKSCGIYNSGFISFGNNAEGLECIDWWKNCCYTLCSNQFRNNQFGDQKYLEQMAIRFKKAFVIKTHGVNIAPWNHSKYIFSCKKNSVLINNEKLICYHFSGFRLLNDLEFSLSFGNERKPNPILYKPYLQMIYQILMNCLEELPDYKGCFKKENNSKSTSIYKISMFNNSILKGC
ncbi:MAG: hypothetical protein A2Y23_02395 [Clostridiales bacterium GWB2_37_7]|nr:MAG: hypothetical protein A2Y23_02395 [Clostridiales bacterium GWB2_37_7]